jgi:zinc protease
MDLNSFRQGKVEARSTIGAGDLCLPCRQPERRGRGWSWSILGVLLLVLLLLPTKPCAAAAAVGQDKAVLRATLDNGLRVVIVPTRLAPVVTTVINYLAGSDEAPAGFPGTAHAQEHMMFRGSPGLSAGQLADIAAAMGGVFNAATQRVATQYFFAVPAEYLDVALHIEAIRMRGVLDSEKLWEEERGAIEQEVAQDLSSPRYVFYTKLLAAMFQGTPYAHDALGTRPSFDRTTGAMLKKFHDTWYVPNNAIVVIAGDVDPRKALAEVENLFGRIPARHLPQRTPIRLQPVTPETIRLKTDLPYGLATISFRMPGYGSPDYAASVVLADVLSNRRSKLDALVPEGKALYTGFDLDTLPAAGLGHTTVAFPKDANPSTLIGEVRRILTEVAKQGVPADLVQAAKARRLTKAELRKDSVFGLALAWSQALAVEGRQSPDDEIRAIQQVTVADVNRVARKYFDLDHAVTGILTPEPSGKAVSARGFGGAESFTPRQTRNVTLPDWAERALKRLSVPASTVNPEVTVLANGLKLMVQPVSVSDTVSVYGHVDNEPDLEAPKGKEGVDQVVDELFSYGTTALDRVAFQKALDEIGANESAGTDFSLEVLTDHFDRGVELLAENLIHPALPEAAFTVVRQQAAGTVAGQLQSPGYLADLALDAGLYPKGDPSLRQATPASVSSLTLEDVRDYYRKVFRPDLTVLVVVGKVTAEKARATVEKYFGMWKGEGPKPNTLLPRVPLNRASATTVPDSSRVQDKVTLAVNLGLTRTNPDYYALELGNSVLGGGFYATRLYRDLRETTGLVYSVGSSFELERTRGRYLVEYACDPPNVSRARAIVIKNLREMQTTLVPPEELNQAKAMLLRRIPLSESSVRSIARGLIYRSKMDLPLDEPILAAKRYVELTAEQVKEAFVRWLRPDDLAQVTQGPPPR